MNSSVTYIAELNHVREVSLLGSADLIYWRHRLQGENLLPIESDGKAQILIIAADSKFRGIPFREISFSVLASRGEGTSRQEGAYLVQALNSSRLFAFCERAFFSTPYLYGDCRLSVIYPPSIQVRLNGEVVFHAAMGNDFTSPPGEPSRREEGGWEGPVFLPGNAHSTQRAGRLFYARIRGQTCTYPFLADRDHLTLKPSSRSAIFQALLDSHLTINEWAVRQDSMHAKSKTVKQ